MEGQATPPVCVMPCAAWARGRSFRCKAYNSNLKSFILWSCAIDRHYWARLTGDWVGIQQFVSGFPVSRRPTHVSFVEVVRPWAVGSASIRVEWLLYVTLDMLRKWASVWQRHLCEVNIPNEVCDCTFVARKLCARLRNVGRCIQMVDTRRDAPNLRTHNCTYCIQRYSRAPQLQTMISK